MGDQPNESREVINTSGGPAIQGNVNTGGGDFAGRDQITQILGDEVHGDKVGGDKVTIGTIINNLFKGDSEDMRKLRNRQAMLKLVYDIWVKGVLEHSLYNQLLIDLDMEQRPEAVERPWGMVLETPAQASRLLPAGTKMIDVFTQLNQSLLILGEPGSGKSTMLLELARDLLAQAAQDPALPIPVLFNLSSWAEKRLPLRRWLVDELREKYQIPRLVAQDWITGDALLLLLDAFDEVKAEHREECIQAINDFQQNGKALVPLALCSRTADYTALTSKLKLHGAILLRSLTSQQIEDFLTRAGDKLAPVAHLLQHDGELQTLAQSPLTFSLLCLVYQDTAVANLQPTTGSGSRQQQLFDAYIVLMFQRPGKLTIDLYPQSQTLHWLAWLAMNMIQRQQNIFLIESLQPDWLEAKAQIWLYRFVRGPVFWWGVALAMTPLGLVIRLLFQEIDPFFLIWVNVLGIRPANYLIYMVFLELVLGLFGGLWLDIIAPDEIMLVERLIFSWPQFDKDNLLWGLGWGLVLGLFLGLVFGLGFGIVVGIRIGFGFGLVGALVGVLFFAVGLGLLDSEEIGQSIKPNQGVWHSARNMWIGGLTTLIVAELIVGLVVEPVGRLIVGSISLQIFGLAGELSFKPGSALVAGIIIGSLWGLLVYGGYSCIQHISLRSLLTFYNYAPLNYARFLDYCADRIFLRKVGGGYIFVHRLLMEHFASLTEEDIKRLSNSEPIV